MFSGIVQVADVQLALDPVHARVGQHGRVGLLVDGVVDVLAQGRDDAVDLAVQIGRGFARTRNDERRARLVDEDGVHFVHDGEVEVALHVALDGLLHVVAQVIEAEFRVGAVGDVAAVVVLAFGIVEAVHDDPDGEAEEFVDAPHPLGIAAGQVVVDGDQVDALAGQRVQVDGQGGDQGLAFAGLHFGDGAAVQDHAADELHVEVAHVDHAAAGLAAHGEGLGQDAVQAFAIGDALPEFYGLGAQLVVALFAQVGLELADARDDGAHAFEDTRVSGAEDLSWRWY
jgi:acylphosphatase